ncbi:hypothetical protein Hte_000547 [Hypoxylon texense]
MAWRCDDCNRCFGTVRARYQHLNALNHAPLDFDCHLCDDFFPDEQGRRHHEVESHCYCAECNRVFMSQNNIRMHLNSRTHRGQTITCPFCQNGFATATGLAHHLESGGCAHASSLNRDEVYKAVRAKDPGGLISKKLIGWHGSSPTYEATGMAWNGSAWECYFCHRNFLRVESLNQHLNSPAHQQPLYHCPNRNGCGRDFKTLAAISPYGDLQSCQPESPPSHPDPKFPQLPISNPHLQPLMSCFEVAIVNRSDVVVNHLESETCNYTRFETVQRTVGDIMSGNRLLTFG